MKIAISETAFFGTKKALFAAEKAFFFGNIFHPLSFVQESAMWDLLLQKLDSMIRKHLQNLQSSPQAKNSGLDLLFPF